MQRAGSGLNVKLRFHTLVLDGVFTEGLGGALAFLPTPAPSDAEVAAVLATIRHRVERLLGAPGPGARRRALVIYRDGQHIVSLNMINGGVGQHDNSPYHPLPFAPGVVSGIADGSHAHPERLPNFTMADGSQLIPTARIKDIRTGKDGQRYTTSYRQDELDKLGGCRPQKDGRITRQTTYTLEHGVMTRTDVYTPVGTQEVENGLMGFASFSDRASVQGNTVTFARAMCGNTVSPACSNARWCRPMAAVISWRRMGR